MTPLKSIAAVALAISLTMQAIVLATGFSAIHILWLVPVVGLLGYGLYKQKRSWLNLSFFLLGLIILIASFSYSNGLLLLNAIIGLYMAWDLEAYDYRLQGFGRIDNKQQLIRKHLSSLFAIAVIAIVLFLLATNVNLQINIYTAILLGLVLMFGLAQTLRFLREGDT